MGAASPIGGQETIQTLKNCVGASTAKYTNPDAAQANQLAHGIQCVFALPFKLDFAQIFSTLRIGAR
jgi:hypothetical protein